MLNPFSPLKPLLRFATRSVLAAGLLLMTNGCIPLIKKQVGVPPLLSPRAEANTTQLIDEVNRLASVRSIRGKIDIQFQDTSFAESGIAEKYRSADGAVTVQRPGQIYLVIQGPFSVDIAQMTSDGTHFRVAVIRGDEKYRRFVRGTNSAVYSRLPADGSQADRRDGKNKAMTEQHAVSVLSNLRPQHFTDALLVRPIAARPESGLLYAKSEFYQEEPDTGPRARKGARVIRAYYLLDELSPGGEGGARLTRRFWFDRVGAIRFARMQTYDDDGALVTDVQYGDVKGFGEGGRVPLASRIELTRPQDGYKLTITYQAPEEVVLDRSFDKPETFVLENKWKLPELDLDTRQKKSSTVKQ
jgi:hypothetical protein